MKKILILIAAVSLLMSCGQPKKQNQSDAQPETTKTDSVAADDRGYIVTVGQMAPNVQFALPDGTVKSLTDLRGKVVMMQFTATWCSVCIKEMPFIEKDIWLPLKNNNNFALFGLMYKQTAEDAKKMKELTGVTYPLVPDAEGTYFHAYAAQGAGVTRNVIVDKEGKIAFMTRLYNEEEFAEMVSVINKLVNQ